MALETLRKRGKQGLSALVSDEEYTDSQHEDDDDDDFIVNDSNNRPTARSRSSSSQQQARRYIAPSFKYDDKNDYYDDDDLDDFIAPEDEEEDEEDEEEDAEEELIFDNGKDNIGKSKIKRSKTDVNDTEDDDDDEVVYVTPSSKRARLILIEDSEQDEQEDEDEDEESDESVLDGPAMYAQVDALLREKEEKVLSYTKKHYSRAEAMRMYIELLARVHTEPNYVARNLDLHDKTYVQYLAAAKMIEDVMCTTRESLCSSGAWNRGKFCLSLYHKISHPLSNRFFYFLYFIYSFSFFFHIVLFSSSSSSSFTSFSLSSSLFRLSSFMLL